MRTSKISRETIKFLNDISLPPRRSTRSDISRFAHNASAPIKNEDEDEAFNSLSAHIKTEDEDEDDASSSLSPPPDIEDFVPSRKRKRVSRTPIKRSPNKKTTIKTEIEHTVTLTPTKERRVRKPARQVKNEETGEVEIHPPNDWAEVYAVVKEMRLSGKAQNAAVDTMGCESLGEDTVSPKVKRFHTLTALMLSSQTKDTTNAVAMKRLQTQLPAYKEAAVVGLNLENILAVDPVLLNELIWVVGFHNNKTKYIKATAEILRDKFDGDIPDTIDGLMSLPGVGPKMAYLCMSSAWGRHEGIGVDVHVHRITNLWGWNQTKGPEETRKALQAWLPKALWHEINWLLVGFGQTMCLPVGRKCGDCELGLKGLCKSAERAKVTIGRKMREEKIKKDEEGEVVMKSETGKVEETTEDVPVNAAPNDEVVVAGGVEELPIEEGLAKEEEKVIMDDIANAPGEFQKTLQKDKE